MKKIFNNEKPILHLPFYKCGSKCTKILDISESEFRKKKRMSRYVQVELTQAEAQALAYAAGDILEACGFMEQRQFFGNEQSARAGRRGLEKLNVALRKPSRLHKPPL